jgi:ABC-type glycerol-3-phosphate transport system substrate-binding protein
MKRPAALALVALAVGAAACGGSPPAGEQAQPAPAAKTTAAKVAHHEPTPEQLAARKELLRQIAAGTYTCSCTSAERARDRVARGLAKAPHSASR